MKLEEIKEIKICHNAKDVNAALNQGYTINKIIQSRSNGDNLEPCFILVKS